MEFNGTRERRLAVEQAIMRRGYTTFKEVAEACEIRASRLGLNLTFNPKSIQHYVGCYTTFSIKRLKILADLLGTDNLAELDEKFTPPATRGVGQYWVGDMGNRVQDYDATRLRVR